MSKIKYYWAMLLDVINWRKVGRIILYILLCILIAIVSSARQSHKDKIKYEALMADELAAMSEAHELELTELRRQYEYGGDIDSIEREAECIAKVLYGTAQHHSVDGQRAVVWCILNRVEHASYPDTVIEVCEQPQQWMGYSEDNPVVEELYDVALDVLKTWYNDGHRPVGPAYIYLSWSSDEIILRDKFEEKGAHYWRIG